MSEKPTVLFVCVHNAGRSQMAAGYLQHLGGGRIEVLSAGSEPADRVNPAAVEAMRARGEATVPTTIALERATNVFMRAGTVEELARRRTLKDQG